MSLRREETVRRQLEGLLESLAEEGPGDSCEREAGIADSDALACFEAGVESRIMDLVARELKDRGEGFYTIGSAGHEANGILGRQLRSSDPCLLHYRSGAFMASRAAQVPGERYLYDTLLSLTASAEDPVSGGRHKVWGSRRMMVPPQTSTIASQLPKAVGMAFSMDRRAHLGLPLEIPEDSIVMVSFGDASANHASAVTAFNAAGWAQVQHLPCPILFVCEDNGVGISVHTPDEWIPQNYGHRMGLSYYRADGRNLAGSWETVKRAIDNCRTRRRPTFLHLDVVRLMGHAGSDVEANYHEERVIRASEVKDPLLAWARYLCETRIADGQELLARYHEISERVRRVADLAITRPKIETLAEIIEPLRWPAWEEIRASAEAGPERGPRTQLWGGDERLPELDRPRHMAMQISRALKDLMLQHGEILIFGEDVAKKGGVYHVTSGLFEAFGVGRVFNTLLDETMIFGTAIGAAQLGFLPIPEIQYLAYLHNAEDQLRGEACSQRFFSQGQWDNPMVVRIAALAYQKGFGGHFHNDTSIAVLRDIPGLVIALPSRGDDAVGMLRTCVAAARVGRAVCTFLEPIALYMSKDLHEKGDGLWSFAYPSQGEAVPIGEPRSYAANERARILLVTYGNGVPMALRARKALGRTAEDCVEILDLRWIAPLPVDVFLEKAEHVEEILLLDECRRTMGGVSESLASALAESAACRGTRLQRLCAEDSYVPLGKAAELVLPSEASVQDMLKRALSDLADAPRIESGKGGVN